MTAVDLTPGATLSNGGVVTADGRVGIGGDPTQYGSSGEPDCGHNVVSTPEKRLFRSRTSYGGAAVPDHSNVAGGTQSSPTATPNNTNIWDDGARCFSPSGTPGFNGSSYARRVITTQVTTGNYTGCKELIELTPNGGVRQVVRETYGNGDHFLPVVGSRLIVGASDLSGMSNGSGVVMPLTADVGNILWVVGRGNGSSFQSHYVGATSGGGFSYQNASNYFGKDATTGRSLNAGGSINASGSDYAEYERKSALCGRVIKGQIIGFDAQGAITDKWSEAISFGVKSTDPCMVGGDVWGMGGVKAAALARPTVDRIAYCGKVPVNVWGAKPGQYIIPVRNGAGIDGKAVRWKLWRKPVGRVRRMLPDGRAEIVVTT